jgi:hypothetical protein
MQLYRFCRVFSGCRAVLHLKDSGIRHTTYRESARNGESKEHDSCSRYPHLTPPKRLKELNDFLFWQSVILNQPLRQ